MPVIQGLGWTFDTVALQYEKLRPGYADALYRQIFAYCPVSAQSKALEVGVGGGQATEPVLKTGCWVIAVEPGENFCALCRKKFREYSGFSVLNGKFEDVALERDAYDLVYSASAFHWVPEEVGYKKVFECLKKGGAFARFANHPYKDKSRPGMHEALQEVYAVYMPGTLASDEYTDEKARKRAEIAMKYGFVDVQHHLFHRTRDFTAAEYIQLLGTYSDHIAIEKETRGRFFAEIEQAINRMGGVITIFDTMDLQLARKPE
ncbi:MAG: class I SAM-dependent methyltransferase [Clostridia bacterium]|nr:class I SAM-dependent methyltransferase [Clostridia bacterium]